MPVLDLLIPFFGTALGSAAVFLMRNSINTKAEKFLLGFASGVMVAASVFSLIIPSIELSVNYALTFIPAAVGLTAGTVFLIILDRASSHLQSKDKTAMMILAVTLHNIPEGMAVGVTVAAAVNTNSKELYAAAATLALGIAIQNFPEGAIISMPLKSQGVSKLRAFTAGVLSGAVEPVAGVITMLITGIITAALPYLLSFAAGAMLYVVYEELIPESRSESTRYIGISGFTLGFIIMMALDVFFS